MDCDTCFKMQKILRDEIDDREFLEFAIENFCEMFGHINTGRVNIWIHRDITGGCGWGWVKCLKNLGKLTCPPKTDPVVKLI